MSMQFGTVKQAPSESEDDLKFFGTGHTHRTDARGVRVGGATGSSAELIAWRSQLTSSSRHRAMCQPKQGQEGASLQDTSCLKRSCSKKHSERSKTYSSRGCTGRSTSKHSVADYHLKAAGYQDMQHRKLWVRLRAISSRFAAQTGW